MGVSRGAASGQVWGGLLVDHQRHEGSGTERQEGSGARRGGCVAHTSAVEKFFRVPKLRFLIQTLEHYKWLTKVKTHCAKVNILLTRSAPL